MGGGLLALLLTTSAWGGVLTATREDGTPIARFTVPDGGCWSILWHHSVKGFEVEDRYQNRDGDMVLVSSHLPDFAAGLDHIPGRGRQVSDGRGGYWILDLNEPVPGNAYILRPGIGTVDHRIRIGVEEVSLSAVAPHERVRIALEEDPDE